MGLGAGVGAGLEAGLGSGLGRTPNKINAASLLWTRSCAASLPGLWNHISQYPQMCTIAPVDAGVKYRWSGGMPEAVALFGASSRFFKTPPTTR